MNHSKLVCDVRSITYNYDTRVGIVDIAHGCTDMWGAIDLFKQIDPEVGAVFTFSTGVGQDTFYFRTGTGKNDWKAFDPPRVKRLEFDGGRESEGSE
jgi:hypothetical protein